MVKREKRLKKQIGGLLEQAKKHRAKAETEKGSKDTTKEYWLAEAKRFEEQAKERGRMPKRLKKS